MIYYDCNSRMPNAKKKNYVHEKVSMRKVKKDKLQCVITLHLIG